jgi:hypothetical protein
MYRVFPSARVSAAWGKEYFPRSLDIVKSNMNRMAKGERLMNAYKRGKYWI